VLLLALQLCWIPGVLNLLVDILEEHYGFWHYTANNLFFGFPFDLYVAVSLVIGITLPLVYYCLKVSHPRWVTPLVLLLPLYLLLQDYTVQKITGDAVVVWDSPYWWASDLLALTTITWSTLLIVNYFALRQKPHDKDHKHNNEEKVNKIATHFKTKSEDPKN
jgi:hypothetical protein